MTESQKKTLNLILKFYFDKYDIKKGSSSNSLRFGSTSTSSSNFHKRLGKDSKVIKAHCGRAGWNDLMDALESKFETSNEDDLLQELSGIIFSKMQEIAYKKVIDSAIGKDSANNNTVKTFSYSNIIPIMDISNTQTAMFNVKAGNVVHEITYLAYKLWLDKQPKELKDAHNLVFSPAKIEFDPKTSGDFKYYTTGDGQEIICVNSHNLPEWRKKEIADPKLPKEFEILMKHLFPNELCREYVYFWAYNMLDDRSPIHLLLHGHRGIGKGSLVTIFSELVGVSNFHIAPKNFFDNNFDYELRHKRLLFFDEHKIDFKVNDAEFKQYHEPRMAYHGKGLPVTGIEKNHASHIIANNEEITNHLLYESRRYSVPVIADTPLIDVYGEEFVTELYRLAKTQDFLANVGWWILKNGDNAKFLKGKPYKSSLFYEIVNRALFPWQQQLIKDIESRSNDQYEIASLDLEHRGKPIGRQYIESFLKSHKDEEGKPYGTVKQVKRERFIVPSEKYMPEDTNYNQEEF